MVDEQEMQYHRIDITPMAQAWQRGDLPNNGVLLGGLYRGDIVNGIDLESTSTLYYHGAGAAVIGSLFLLTAAKRRGSLADDAASVIAKRERGYYVL